MGKNHLNSVFKSILLKNPGYFLSSLCGCGLSNLIDSDINRRPVQMEFHEIMCNHKRKELGIAIETKLIASYVFSHNTKKLLTICVKTHFNFIIVCVHIRK